MTGQILKRWWWDTNPNTPRTITLWWEFVDGSLSQNYEVWVERSGSHSGPFYTIAKTFNSVHFVDEEIRVDLTELPIYRLRVVERHTGDTVQLSEAILVEAVSDIVAKEIKFRTDILIRNYSGLPVLYYPVRMPLDTRCPDCWDEDAKHRTKSHCKTCYDTGYLIGYYNPILTYMQIVEDPTGVAQNSETDESFVRTGRALLSGNHLVKIGDLIVESTMDRWLVSSYSVTEHLRSYTSFTIQLHHLQESDIRSTIELPGDDSLINIMRSDYRLRRPLTINP